MSNIITRKADGRFYKNCPKCGEEQSYLRENYARHSLNLGLTCKSCSNKVTENCSRGWYKSIRVSWYYKFKKSAVTRGIEWHISIDYVAALYLKQDKKCALSGVDIEFPECGHPQNCLASIDRIDNDKPYTKDNVQLVLKNINMMKGKYSQEEFINICTLVAKHINKI